MKIKIEGTPNTVRVATVITFIGIIKLSGDAIKLNPYSAKKLIDILFIILNIFFIVVAS